MKPKVTQHTIFNLTCQLSLHREWSPPHSGGQPRLPRRCNLPSPPRITHQSSCPTPTFTNDLSPANSSPKKPTTPENRGQPTPDPPARKRDSQHPASSIPTQSRVNLNYNTQNAITIKPTNHSAFNPSLNPILIQTPFVLYLISPNVIFHLPQKQTTKPRKAGLTTGPLVHNLPRARPQCCVSPAHVSHLFVLL